MVGEIKPEPLPFDEAIRYWRGKVPLTADKFYALAMDQRAKAFTVSGVTRMDMIEEVKAAVDAALKSGITLADFKKAIADIIEAQGWKDRRVDTIFRSNMQSAYNAGRYKQQTDPDVLKQRPYWQYVAVMDERTRPEHAALDGKVFPADDPFWGTWYPPNGFNCRCTVRTLSESEMDELGLKSETADPTGRLFEPVDPETGVKMPPRLLVPDPGWSINQAKQAWVPDLSKYPDDLRRRFEQEQQARSV